MAAAVPLFPATALKERVCFAALEAERYAQAAAMVMVVAIVVASREIM